ncbi:MAG: hypothetical protein K5839_02730 [Treponemataceae bacterium]|nr:hypothetical protein [Treponemataceae bacterium]
MSEVFENDIDDINEKDLQSLEDDDNDKSKNFDNTKFVFPNPLFKLKLEYSCEGIYATAPDGMKLNAGDYVIIPTRYGKDLARVMGISKEPIGIRPSDVIQIERKGNDSDLDKYKAYIAKEDNACKVFREKVAIHKLDIKLIATHYLLEEPKVIFFFSSENRVDFRELVKDLVSVFKMRIELRQIGVRDESRITGGLGVCGRPYCCHAISDCLKSVSIKMAKEQNLSLNSMKISGQCGRLLCCLSYEMDCYTEARKKMPSEGARFYYDGTNFRVIEINPLLGMVKMLGEDGRILEIPASRYKNENGKWKIISL